MPFSFIFWRRSKEYTVSSQVDAWHVTNKIIKFLTGLSHSNLFVNWKPSKRSALKSNTKRAKGAKTLSQESKTRLPNDKYIWNDVADNSNQIPSDAKSPPWRWISKMTKGRFVLKATIVTSAIPLSRKGCSTEMIGVKILVSFLKALAAYSCTNHSRSFPKWAL